MIIKHNVRIYDICWLNHAQGGVIGTFYEPESKEELTELCRSLYKEGKLFDLIGHTSNIYFLPNYSVDIMVSTRKVKQIVYSKDYIIADCGANVKALAHAMVNEGVKGFEGLIDLPGTIAASVYGNASCFGCSINSMLVSVEFLKDNGEIVTLKSEELKLKKRSSALKRGELKGIILSVKLRKEYGDSKDIIALAERNHKRRLETQPGPKDNLGSIYAVSNGFSRKSWLIRKLASVLCILLRSIQRDKVSINSKDVILRFYNAKELQPYVYGWNRYIWKDEKSHELFWKFHQIHQKLFNESKFEIEIKGIK